MQFEVKYTNGESEIVEGSRIYSEKGMYVIDDTTSDNNEVWSADKSKVKCISPIKGE